MNNFKKVFFCLTLALAFNPHLVMAQAGGALNKRGKSIIDVSLYNGLTLNNLNISHNGVFDPMQVPSAVYLSRKFTIDFQRSTKCGLIYGGGIGIGSMRQEFDIDYPSLDFVDTFADFKKQSKKYEYRNKSGALALRLFLGYSHSIRIFGLKQTMLEGKLLISPNYFFKGGDVRHYFAAGYLSNDTVYISYKVSELSGKWGNGGDGISGKLVTEINIGLRKQLTSGFCNNFYMGLYASSNFMLSSYSKKTKENSVVSLTNGHYLNRELQYYTQDFFNNRDLTIGLKLGIGLKI